MNENYNQSYTRDEIAEYLNAVPDCSAQINLAGSQKENRLDVSIRHRFSSSAPDGNDRVAGL